MQAQARPDEAKAAAKKAEAEIAEEATVAVAAEEPEFEGSFITEFKLREIAPAVARAMPRTLEIEPVITLAPQVARPSLSSDDSSAPPSEAGFVPFRDGGKRLVLTPRGAEAATACAAVQQVFPALPERSPENRNPASAHHTPLTDRPLPRNAPVEVRAATVDFIEPTAPRIEMPAYGVVPSSVLPSGEDLPKAGKIAFDIPIAPPEEGSIEIELLGEFSDLSGLQAVFDLTLALIAEEAEAQPEAQSPPAVAVVAEAVDTADTVDTVYTAEPPEAAEPEITETEEIPDDASPRMALAALSNLQVAVKLAEPIAPPISQAMRRITLPAVAPSASVLSPGFDCVPIQTLPRMQRYNTQPLRPKMVLVTVARPSAAAATSAGRSPAKEVPKAPPKSILDINGGSKHEAPKHGSRSMLHLDDEGSAEPENVPDSGSLFGRLGGLFGKKNKGS